MSTNPSASTLPQAVRSPRCLGEIDRRRDLSVEEFRATYVEGRRPVLLEGMAAKWPAFEKWTFEFFAQRYGEVQVPVGQCFKLVGQWPLGRYLDQLESLRVDPDAPTRELPPVYMEGWYYRPSAPELVDDYRIEPHFSNDLFKTNFPVKPPTEPYGILIGPRGAFTKLHFDLWATHSWNAQIRGRKRWVFVSPDQSKHCYMKLRQSHGYVPGTDVDRPDLEKYPDLGKVQYYETIANPGDVVWFPSMWLHQVTSLDDTISVTHNYASKDIYFRVLKHYMLQRLGKKAV